MKRTIFSAIALGFLLVSCNSKSPWDEQEEAFMSGCEESYVSSFKNALEPEYLDLVDLNELDKLANDQCSCMFEAIKEKYETPEEALSKGYGELMKEVKGCEPSEAELDKLLKEE